MLPWPTKYHEFSWFLQEFFMFKTGQEISEDTSRWGYPTVNSFFETVRNYSSMKRQISRKMDAAFKIPLVKCHEFPGLKNDILKFHDHYEPCALDMLACTCRHTDKHKCTLANTITFEDRTSLYYTYLKKNHNYSLIRVWLQYLRNWSLLSVSACGLQEALYVKTHAASPKNFKLGLGTLPPALTAPL